MKTILLVDDSAAVRMVARKYTNSLGLRVLEAENGAVALDIARRHPQIDVVLLDWNMPIMDGMTFLRALRAEARECQPIVVMCTTENELPRIMQAMEAGANEYIMKPFNAEIVRDKLQQTGIL